MYKGRRRRAAGLFGSAGGGGAEPSPFYDYALTLGFAAAWPMNDPVSSEFANDLTGNERPGTYSTTGGGQTLEQPSIIPGEPSTCAHNHASTTFVLRSHEAWMVPGNTFSVMFTAQPDALGNYDIFGKVDSFQVWLNSDGTLTSHISPAWTSFNSSNDVDGKMVAGESALIIVRQDAAISEVSLWLRGIKVGSASKSNNLSTGADLRAFGASTNGSRKFIGYGQGFFYGPSLAVTDAQITDLQTLWEGGSI